MENYVLYEEQSKLEHCVIHKGRRKGTINFVAIHCIDKCCKAQTTNRVRLTNELEHENIVKFYEWYETSNHLWLVVELCTGGRLDELILQDGHLPESSVRTFGINLVEGLFHIHSAGIVYADLTPSSILVDGRGILKFDDFSLARVDGENLKDIYKQFLDLDEDDEETDADLEIKTMGTPAYTAPEVLQGGEYTIMSDLWALGCVLYELSTGHTPFQGDSFEQLVDNILNQNFPIPKVKGGSRLTSKASPDFLNFIQGLLNKSPHERISWKELVTHPFWQNHFTDISKELSTSDDSPVTGRKSTLKDSTRSSLLLENKASSVLGQIKEVDLKSSEHFDMERPASSLKESLRPKSAMDEDGRTIPLFTLSSRPGTAQPPDSVNLPSQHSQRSAMPKMNEINLQTLKRDGTQKESSVKNLIQHSSDWLTTHIIDNHKILKTVPLKYDSKALIVPPYSVDKIMSLSSKEQQKHIKAVLDVIDSPEKGPPTQKRIHLLNYSCVLASNPHLATLMVSLGAFGILIKQLKDVSHFEHRTKVCRCLGLVALHTTELPEDLNLSEVVATLTDVIRDNFRNAKLKQCLLPALGEVLFRIATQEEIAEKIVEKWTVSSVTYTIINRCLRDGEDAVINHYAAKIVENISSKPGIHQQNFTTNEVGQSLWYIFTHSTIDVLRITAISALSRLTSYSVNIVQHIIEKVGLNKLLDALSLGIPAVQRAMLTMCVFLLSSGSPHANRMVQQKDYIVKIMRFLESPSLLVRAKSYLVVMATVQCNPEMLLNACQLRLVMYMERDSWLHTKQSVNAEQNQSQLEYMSKCLETLVNYMVSKIPQVFEEIVTALGAVSGRKHPSTVQAKQLKASLPLLGVVYYLTTSQLFRQKIVTLDFIQNVGKVLNHVRSIDSGETSIESATGSSGSEDLINTTFSLIESLVQHPCVIVQFGDVITDCVLPILALMLSSQNGDTRVQSLRLFTEIVSVFFSEEEFDVTERPTIKNLPGQVKEALLPHYEQILLDQDPLPSIGLKLLLALFDHAPSYIMDFKGLGLVPVLFQVLLDHQSYPCSLTMQYLIGIINCIVTHKDCNMAELYEQGFVDHMCHLIKGVTQFFKEDRDNSKTANRTLQLLLDTLHSVLKNLSDIVKKALQAKKNEGVGSSREAEQAELMLLANKAFLDLTSIITQLLCHEDEDVASLACKSLSLMVQLFGGEHTDSLSPQNMESYSKALTMSDSRKQKIILRIIKRLVATDPLHCQNLASESGQILQNTLHSMISTASSHADVQLASIIGDILKLITL